MMALPQGGFDVLFVEPLIELWICPICRLAAQEPYMTHCGHQFCLECLMPLVRNDYMICPVCRTELMVKEVYPNNMAKREILSLKIWCDKHEEGCSWTGELRHRDRHNHVCGHVTELCSNNCGELMMRKDMDDHKRNACSRRIVVCYYCNEQLEYSQLVSHYETCENYLVDCPYECGMLCAKKDVELHISREGDCLISPLQCDFVSAGCDYFGNREQLKDHLNKGIINHLILAMKSLDVLAERLAVAEEKQKETEGKLAAAEKKQKESDKKLVAAEKKQHETDCKLADAEKKQKGTVSKLAVAEKEREQAKAQLAATRADYEELKECLDVELKSSKTYRMLMKDGLKMSLQSVTFVNAALDGQTEMSLEVGDSFVYLWKIDAQQLTNSQGNTKLEQVPTEKNVLSKRFYTGNPGLCLQLELCVIPDALQYSITTRVYRCKGQYDLKLCQSKYLMSICLLGRHGSISCFTKETDFELQMFTASTGHLFKLDQAFPFFVLHHPNDVLCVTFQLEQQTSAS